MDALWRPSKVPLTGWLGALFVPGLLCYLHSVNLNEYPILENSRVERLDGAKLDAIIPRDAKVERVANGFVYTEGPLWVHDEEAGRGHLLFSDVPNNKLWKWEEGGSFFSRKKSLFLDNAGCRGDHCALLPFPGPTGLTLVPGSGELVMCEHGNRIVARTEINGTKTVLATHFNGHRLNSPNDLALSKRGDLYFTDPPYGFPLLREDPSFAAFGIAGVYRIQKEAMEATRASENIAPEPELVEKELAWPDGLALSPDSSKLYISHCSVEEPFWYVYDVNEDGRVSSRSLFFDGRPILEMTECQSLGPDGMEVDKQGNIFASASCGVAVFSPSGEHLATIVTGENFISNVVIGGDGYLYMTASDSILRIKVLTKAAP